MEKKHQDMKAYETTSAEWINSSEEFGFAVKTKTFT